MKEYKLPIPPIIILLVGVISISFSSIFIKWSTAPASILGMYRLLFTVIVMLPFLPWKDIKKGDIEIRLKDWIQLFLSEIFLGLHF
ncbi:EamA family transporter [Bacillus smithii]|uniref:EamA family transporter n=1 Tax=Bacillus smithii TaxID=1479 RepID=UPI003D22D835